MLKIKKKEEEEEAKMIVTEFSKHKKFIKSHRLDSNFTKITVMSLQRSWNAHTFKTKHNVCTKTRKRW